MKIFSLFRKLRGLPLSSITLLISLITHLFIFLVLPNLAEQRETDLTTRDLKFLLEEIFTTKEKANIPPELISDEPLKQIIPESEKPVNETAKTDGGELAEPLPWVISHRSTPPQARHRPSTKPLEQSKPSKPEQARTILKELEKEWSLQPVSDKNTTRRPGVDKKYIDQVHERLQSQYFIPPKAKKEKMFGQVTLQLTISTDGTIKKIIFLERSDFPLLDRAAYTAVENAAPFPNIKDKVDMTELVFIVPFVFE